MVGRCASPCGSYADCGPTDACWSGGCIPRYALLASQGGDQQLWVVALPGHADLTGGCQATGDGKGGALGLLLVALIALRLRRRRSAG